MLNLISNFNNTNLKNVEYSRSVKRSISTGGNIGANEDISYFTIKI